jgi:hypothetical protein
MCYVNAKLHFEVLYVSLMVSFEVVITLGHLCLYCYCYIVVT